MTKRMKNTEGSSSKMMRGVQSILELPIGILYDIISRLPLQAIRSCKCVCKTYRNIIKDPHFAKLHLSKELVTSAALIVLNSEPHSSHFPPYMLDLDVTHSGHLTCDQHLLSWPRGFTREYVKEYFCTNNVSLVSSCNGLLCLNSIALEDPLFYIYNSLGGECMTLPTLESYSLDSHYYVDSGFGFCPTSKKYKVICFMRGLADPEGSSVLVLVHTVGTDSWKIIGDVPCPIYRGSFDSLLGGSSHWIGDNSETPELICSFSFV